MVAVVVKVAAVALFAVAVETAASCCENLAFQAWQGWTDSWCLPEK